MIKPLQTNQTEYMYSDVTPLIPEVDLEKLKEIESKLKSYTSGNKNVGLNLDEIKIFLDWITLNARNYAVRTIPIPREQAITSEPMTGQCAPTQNINVKLLRKFKLDARPFNTGDCIDKTKFPSSQDDLKKVQNGWYSTATRHSIAVVTLPELTFDNKVQESDFVLDPTFRQFCFLINNQSEKFTDKDWLSKGHVAPHPAYFMQEDFCKNLIQNGYFRLNSETAKLYGDAFKHSSVRKEYQDQIQETTGEEYINYFKTIPMQLSQGSDENKFILLPSEIDNSQNQRKGFLKKINDWFKRKFGSKSQETKLPSSNKSSEVELFLDNLKPRDFSETSSSDPIYNNSQDISSEKEILDK